MSSHLRADRRSCSDYRKWNTRVEVRSGGAERRNDQEYALRFLGLPEVGLVADLRCKCAKGFPHTSAAVSQCLHGIPPRKAFKAARTEGLALRSIIYILTSVLFKHMAMCIRRASQVSR